MNYSKYYYSNGARKPDPVVKLSIAQRIKTDGAPTGKQYKYYQDLLSFLRHKGADTSLFERVKSARDCRTKIHAIQTTIRKNGWAEELWGPEE